MAEYLQVRSNGEITLSASILRKANLKEGDWLEAIVESDGSIRLVARSGDEKLSMNILRWITRRLANTFQNNQ